MFQKQDRAATRIKVISTTFRHRFLLQKPEHAQTTPTLQNLCCIGMQNIAHYEFNVLSKQTKVSLVRTTAGMSPQASGNEASKIPHKITATLQQSLA